MFSPDKSGTGLGSQPWLFGVNRRGQSTQPWGTPLFNARVEEVRLPIRTVWGPFVRKSSVHCPTAEHGTHAQCVWFYIRLHEADCVKYGAEKRSNLLSVLLFSPFAVLDMWRHELLIKRWCPISELNLSNSCSIIQTARHDVTFVVNWCNINNIWLHFCWPLFFFLSRCQMFSG